MLELRKDIILPGQYFRAGQRLAREEWLKLFPHLYFQGDWDEWFLDPVKVTFQPSDIIEKLVDEIFESRNLKSITYKQAAAECVRKYIQFNQNL